MLRRKVLALGAALVMSFGMFGGLSVSAKEAKTITLYSGGSDNVRAAWDLIIKEFEAENPDIKVQLEFIASGTSSQSAVDKLIAAEKAGEKSVNIDLVEVNDGDVAKLIKEVNDKAIAKIDTNIATNLKNVTIKPPVGEGSVIPFRGTTVVLAYNSEVVPNPPKTADELYAWIKANPGRFAYNDPTTGGSGSSFVVTAIYNQLPAEAFTSEDPKWKNEWNKGFDLLKDLNQYMYKASGKVQYPAKNQGTLDLLANGEVDMIPSWADMALEQKSKGLLPEAIKITQIEPSFTGGVMSLIIPAKSQKQAEATKFINFVISKKGQNAFLDNMKAIPVITSEELGGDSKEKLAGLQISKFRTYFIGNLSGDLMKMWQEQIPTLNQ